MAIYKKSIKKNTINLIFLILLLLKSFISYDRIRNFDYNLNYQLILFK